MFKRAAIVSSVALCAVPLAIAEDSKECLIVHMHGGSRISYVLEDTPVVTFEGENLHVEASQLSDDHKLAEVEKFTFENMAALPLVQADEWRITISDHNMTLEGVTPLIHVTLSDIQGRTIAATNANTEGIASLSLSGISKGVYIVSTSDGKSFKIFTK